MKFYESLLIVGGVIIQNELSCSKLNTFKRSEVLDEAWPHLRTVSELGLKYGKIQKSFSFKKKYKKRNNI